MREFAGARCGVSREELGKWDEEGFAANFANFAVQILLGVGCGMFRELLVVERW
jgi:hypothetical protein